MPFDKQGRWFPDANGRSAYTPTLQPTQQDMEQERKQKTAKLALAALEGVKGLLNVLPRATNSDDYVNIQKNGQTFRVRKDNPEAVQPQTSAQQPQPIVKPIAQQPAQMQMPLPLNRRPLEDAGWQGTPIPGKSQLSGPDLSQVLLKTSAFKNIVDKQRGVTPPAKPVDYGAMASMVDQQRERQLNTGVGQMNAAIPAAPIGGSYGDLLKSTDKAINDALVKGDTASFTLAMMNRQNALNTITDLHGKVPTIGPDAREIPFSEQVMDTAKNFGEKTQTWGANFVQGAAETVPGVSALERAVTGHDTNAMAKEYLDYVNEVKKNPSLGQAMSPEDYFKFQGKMVGASEASDILRRAGIDQGIAGGDSLIGGHFAGNVAGTLAGLLGGGAGVAAKGATKLAETAIEKLGPKLAGTVLEKLAPKWLQRGIQKVVPEVIGGATTGAAYQTEMEANRELAHPEEATLGQHLQNIGNTSLYYAGYGVGGPLAEKLMGKTAKALPKKVQNVMHTVEHKAPRLSHVAESVTEGLISGSFVGLGQGLGVLATTGSPQKAWDQLTSEAKSEMSENFVESIGYSLMRRGGFPVHAGNFGINDGHDPVESIVNGFINKLSDTEKDEYNEAMKDADNAGIPREVAHSILIDKLTSESEVHAQKLAEAVQEEFDSHVENKVANQSPVVQPETSTIQQQTNVAQQQPEATQPEQQQAALEAVAEPPVTDNVINNVTNNVTDNVTDNVIQPQTAPQTKRQPVTDPQPGMDVNMAGKGDQLFTVQSVDNKGMVTLQTDKGGELTVHKGNLFTMPQVAAPGQASSPASEAPPSMIPEAVQGTGQKHDFKEETTSAGYGRFVVPVKDGRVVITEFGQNGGKAKRLQAYYQADGQSKHTLGKTVETALGFNPDGLTKDEIRKALNGEDHSRNVQNPEYAKFLGQHPAVIEQAKKHEFIRRGEFNPTHTYNGTPVEVMTQGNGKPFIRFPKGEKNHHGAQSAEWHDLQLLDQQDTASSPATEQPKAEEPTGITVNRTRNQATVTHQKLPGVRVSISELVNKKGVYTADYIDHGEVISIKKEFSNIEEGVQWASNTLQKDFASQNTAEQPKTETTTEQAGNKAPDHEVTPTAEKTGGLSQFTITTTKHTKTGETLFVVKPKQRLTPDDFKVMKAQMSKIGGIYSKFTHGFNFKSEPTDRLAVEFGPAIKEGMRVSLQRMNEGTVFGTVIGKEMGAWKITLDDGRETFASSSSITIVDESPAAEAPPKEDNNNNNDNVNEQPEPATYDRKKTYPFKLKQDKPIQDYDYHELMQEVVDFILDTTGIRGTVEKAKSAGGTVISTLKHAIVDFKAEGSGVKITGEYKGGPDKLYQLEIEVAPRVLPYKISNFRDLLNQYVYKTMPQEPDPLPKFKYGSKVQVVQNDGSLRDATFQGRYSNARFYVRYDGEDKNTLVEPGRIQQDGVKSKMLYQGAPVYFDGPDGEEIGGLFEGRPPGTSFALVKGFDGKSYRPSPDDLRLEPKSQEKKPTGDNIIDTYDKAVAQTQKLVNNDVHLQHIFKNNPGQNVELLQKAWDDRAKKHALDVANILSGWNEPDHLRFLTDLLDGDMLVNLFENQPGNMPKAEEAAPPKDDGKITVETKTLGNGKQELTVRHADLGPGHFAKLTPSDVNDAYIGQYKDLRKTFNSRADAIQWASDKLREEDKAIKAAFAPGGTMDQIPKVQPQNPRQPTQTTSQDLRKGGLAKDNPAWVKKMAEEARARLKAKAEISASQDETSAALNPGSHLEDAYDATNQQLDEIKRKLIMAVGEIQVRMFNPHTDTERGGDWATYAVLLQERDKLRDQMKWVNRVKDKDLSDFYKNLDQESRDRNKARQKALIEAIRASQSETSAALEPGSAPKNLPMQDILDYSIVGFSKLLEGTDDYQQWSKEMMDEFGPNIRLFLGAIWGQSQWMLNMTEEDMVATISLVNPELPMDGGKPDESKAGGSNDSAGVEGSKPPDVSVGDAIGNDSATSGADGGRAEPSGGTNAEEKPPAGRSGGKGGTDGTSNDNGTRNSEEGNVVRPPSGTQPRTKPADFVITDELDSLGGAKTKFKNNVAAIRLLRQLEAEDRYATPEEQAVLARYVGWGGIPEAFDERKINDHTWGTEYAELRTLVEDGTITEKEYEAMNASTLNAHYTSPTVINAMYEGLKRLGFKGGRVLEPSMGTGNFLGLMPKEVTARSSRIGVELDPVTGGIAKKLYPNASVNVQGFQTFQIHDGYFDLAIGNVPFGTFGVNDNNYNRVITRRIHNYFFIKSLDKVRDGGIVMFISSSGTMNANDNEMLRQEMADRANFLGAVRLPGDAFKANAGTQVTTDIIIFQKRGAGEPENHAGPFVKTGKKEIPVYDQKKGWTKVVADENEWFTAHPELVLGNYINDTLHPGRLGVKSDGRDLTAAITEALQTLPENVYQERTKSPKEFADQQEAVLDSTGWRNVDPGAYYVENGKLMQRQGNIGVLAKLSDTNNSRLSGMIPMRDMVRNLLRDMRDPAITDAEIAKQQKALTRLYDAFVKKHGPINDSRNKNLLRTDPIGGGLLTSIEQYEREGKTVTVEKKAIFTKRVLPPLKTSTTADTAEESLVLSFYSKGRMDLEYMAELTGRTQEQLISELGDRVFHNPDTNLWESSDEYLSGNVRVKLAAAEKAAERDPRYRRNVEVLTAEQPVDLESHEIKVKIGSQWIPFKDYEDFINSVLGTKERVEVRRDPLSSKWKIAETSIKSWENGLNKNIRNTQEYGVDGQLTFLEIMQDSLNLQPSTVYTYDSALEKDVPDREKTAEARNLQMQIQEMFEDWLWSDPARENRLVKDYNSQYNNTNLREYDGQLVYGRGKEHTTIPGLAENIKLHPWQKDAVWRVLQGKNTLLAHVVGAGKTLEMIVSAMEMRRLGIANKPMFVVPKLTYEQMYDQIYAAYPGAKVLRLTSDELPPVRPTKSKTVSDAEYTKKQEANRLERARVLSQIATGDYDIILIAQPQFTRLPVSPERTMEHIRAQIKDVVDAIRSAKEDEDQQTVKKLEATKKTLEEKLLRNLDEDKKDVVIPFEELGVDYLYVDEAHYYKNLYFHTKMNNVAGLSSSNVQRAEDLYLKTGWLTETRNGGGVVFATGTPISNSMSEMFSLQRYLMGEELRQMGLGHFDAWAAMFGETTTDWEMTASGQFKQRTRFARFNNIPELLQMFFQFADVKTREMLDLPTPPNVERETVPVRLSRAQKSYMMELVERAKNMSAADRKTDNFLKLTTDGKSMAVDLRLVKAGAEDDPDSKLNTVVREVARVYNDKEIAKDENGNTIDNHTQIVFLDLGTPKKNDSKATDEDEETDSEGKKTKAEEAEEQKFRALYQDIKDKLIKQGIPANEIAFIHDAKKPEQKLMLSKKVNDGRIRILLGSSAKAGVGLNVQEKLVAIHNVDPTWTPAGIEQREGRILRQGNKNNRIHIYTYVAQDSFDALMWDLLRVKATFIAQMMSGKIDVRSQEDVGAQALGFAQIAGEAMGNTLMKDKLDADRRVFDLSSERTRFERNRRNAEARSAANPSKIRDLEKRIKNINSDTAVRQDTRGDHFSIVLDGKTYDKRKEADEALDELVKANKTTMKEETAGTTKQIGVIGGTFKIFLYKGHSKDSWSLELYGPSGVRYYVSDIGIAQLENSLYRGESMVTDAQEDIQTLQAQIDDSKRILEVKFEKGDALREALRRVTELERQIEQLNMAHDNVVGGDSEESGGDGETNETTTMGLAAPARIGNSTRTAAKRPSVRKSVIQSIARLIEPSKLVLTPKAAEKLADILTKTIGTIMEKDNVGPRRLGEYDYKHNIGRVRSANFGEWRVIGHEIGHAFDNLMGYIGDDAELRAMYLALYPKVLRFAKVVKDPPVKTQIAEGFAEFFQQWVVDPALALKNAPLTAAKFEQAILKNPKLNAIFGKIRTIVDADLKDDALGRFVAGGMVSDIQDDGATMGAAYEVGRLRRAIFEAADSLIPAKDMAKAAGQTGYKNADLLVKLLSITGDAQSKGLSAFEAPMRDTEGRFLAGKSLNNLYQDIVDRIGEGIGWEEVSLSTVNREVKVLNKSIYTQYKKMGARDIAGAILVAQRVQERREKGHDTLPMTEEMAQEIMDIAKARFPEAITAAEEFSKTFSLVVLDKLERAGVLDTETRQRVEKGSQFYIPFIYDEKKAPQYRRGTNKGGQTFSTGVSRFKGKFQAVIDPVQAVIMKLTQVEQAIEYKRVIDEIMNMAGHEGMGAFASVIPMSKVAAKLDMGEMIASIMKTVGISDDTEFGQDLTTLSDVLQGQTMTIFSRDTWKTLNGEPVIMNWVNGKPVPIKLAPDMFKMIMAMKPIQMNAFMKGLAFTSKGFRYTALATPTYIKNAVGRDFLVGIIQSKNNVGAMAKHSATSMRVMMGAYLAHRGSDAEWAQYSEAQYQLFISSGAASAAKENMLRGMLGKLYDTDMIHTKAPGWAYAVGRSGKKVLVKTMQTPSDMLRFIEEGPRIAEFIGTIKKEFKKLGQDPEKMYETLVKEGTDALPIELQLEMERILVEATYASGEITTNFRLHGANEHLRQYIPTVTFLHGSIQGLMRTMRQAREHKVATLGYSTLMIGGISALSWALMMAGDDDRKWFQDLPSNMRDKYWWFPNPFMKGTYITVAKPFDYSIMANWGERFLDWELGGEASSRKWNTDFSSLLSTLSGTDTFSNTFKTILQMYSNKNDFGGPIVPQGDMDVYPWMRYDGKTTMTARFIAEQYAKLSGDEHSVSPRMLDYFVQNMLGRWGSSGLTLSDWLASKAFGGERADQSVGSMASDKSGSEYNFWIGSLIYGQAEGGSPRVIEKFYNDYNDTTHMIGTLRSLMNDVDAQGYPSAKSVKQAAKYATDENIAKINSYSAMDSVASFISDSNKEFDAIINDKATPAPIRYQATQKRQYIRRLAAGLLYGQVPAAPHESTGITQTDIEAVISELNWNAEDAQIREEKKTGGPSTISEWLAEIKDGRPQ